MPDPAPHEHEIRRLAALLVNQIAAGEVIERPASVLKELVENAIDAGADRILVELESGGIELVRVIDNGRGIAPAQLDLAITPHATSKVSIAEDLNRIGTMGFRGEALASIASVSRLTIQSRAKGAAEGASIRVEGGQTGPIEPAGAPVGTRVEVRNLFFNTPARRKFLRAPTTEQTRCVEWLRDLAMANPRIGIRCSGDAKVKLDLPPDQDPRQRVLSVLGEELGPELIEVSVDRFDDARGVLIWGLVGRPSIARATAKAQHVFLNGRTIRDRTIQHAVREAYRGLIEPGRHPTAVLMIEMAPDAVDVNVHPAKLEVRFRDQSMIHRAVYHGVRDALSRADVTPSATSRLPGLGAHPTAILPSAPQPEHKPSRTGTVDRLVEALRGPPNGSGAVTSEDTDHDTDLRARIERALDEPQSETEDGPRAHDQGELPRVRPVERVLQVHSSYLITPDEHGVLIIDQHALHERVMFNALLARVEGGAALECQRLLTPIVVDAGAEAVDMFDELDPLLERLGIDAAPMGPTSVGVSGVPSFLHSRGVDPGAFLEELFAGAAREGFVPTREEALHEILDMMACKAAIKAGDALSQDDMGEILRLRERAERGASCPHGRPTSVRLTIEELEKLFDRR